MSLVLLNLLACDDSPQNSTLIFENSQVWAQQGIDLKLRWFTSDFKHMLCFFGKRFERAPSRKKSVCDILYVSFIWPWIYALLIETWVQHFCLNLSNVDQPPRKIFDFLQVKTSICYLIIDVCESNQAIKRHLYSWIDKNFERSKNESFCFYFCNCHGSRIRTEIPPISTR